MEVENVKRIVEKHPLAIRWFHWLHFPLLTIMIWSGLMIYWAQSDARFSGGVYRIGWGEETLFHFFPEGFWNALGMGHQLAQGMAWHFLFMWLFAINGIAYVAYLIVSGQWRYLAPKRGSLLDSLRVILHDLHLSKTMPPYVRYNPAQRIAYTLIILMGGGALITGLAIFRPVQVAWLTSALGGYEWARREHFYLTIGFVLFFVIHVVQVALAGWNNFRSMVAGFEIIDDTGDGHVDA